MSFENHSLNSSCESNRLGIMKCNSAQSSVRDVRVRVEAQQCSKRNQRTLHVVLNRGSSQQQPITAVKPKQRLPTHAGGILDVLSLIENHILPLDTLEVLLILSDELVAGNQYMKGGVLVVADLFLAPEFSERCPIFDITPVREGLQGWDETSELLLPVVKG